jgi:hypothetical protein
MSQVIEGEELERAEERELGSGPRALAAVLWGLLLEVIDGGSFSIGAWAWKSLAFGAVIFAWTALRRVYQRRGRSAEDRSNPLM